MINETIYDKDNDAFESLYDVELDDSFTGVGIEVVEVGDIAGFVWLNFGAEPLTHFAFAYEVGKPCDCSLCKYRTRLVEHGGKASLHMYSKAGVNLSAHSLTRIEI